MRPANTLDRAVLGSNSADRLPRKRGGGNRSTIENRAGVSGERRGQKDRSNPGQCVSEIPGRQHTNASVRPASPVLSFVIPRLSKHVVPGFVMASATACKPATEASTGEIAQAFLDAGVLKESDWCGDLEKSINAGLLRWVNQDLGAAHHRELTELEFVYSNDFRNIFEEDTLPEEWYRMYCADQAKAAGCFGLKWNVHSPVSINVSSRVLQMEKEFPGLGYGILDLIEKSFNNYGIMGHGFHWAYEEMESAWECWGDDVDNDLEEAEARGLMSPRSWSNHIPHECTNVRWDRSIAIDALRKARRSIVLKRKRLAGIIECVLKLDDLMASWRKQGGYNDHLNMLESYQCSAIHHPTCYLYWTGNDDTHRCIDDAYQSAMQQGSLTQFTWFYMFQIGKPYPETKRAQKKLIDDSRRKITGCPRYDDVCKNLNEGRIEWAIDSARRALEMLAVQDKILYWLDKTSPLRDFPKPSETVKIDGYEELPMGNDQAVPTEEEITEALAEYDSAAERAVHQEIRFGGY